MHGLSCCSCPALEHRLSSCDAWAYLLLGMRDLAGPGIEPMSPAWAGGFFTSEPPGKLRIFFFSNFSMLIVLPLFKF